MSRTRTAARSGGFTLIEIMVASIGAAMILVAVYGLFYHAVKMRDNATEHTRESRLRARAVNAIRNDLRGAMISGGVFATTLEGGGASPASSFPGYLKISTTTGKDTSDAMYGDVQQIEYYISSDKTGTGGIDSGTLVRAITRDLLSSVQQTNAAQEEQVLPGVKSMEVAFYDGQSWKDSWQYSTTAPTIPEAVRVRIQQASVAQNESAPPLEILVPWATQPFTVTSATSTTSQ